MNEPLMLIVDFVAGVMLGVFFFGGLWWTLKKAVLSSRPALWLLGSLLLRTSTTLAGMYFVSGGHWQSLLVCLLGFVVARFIIIRLTPSKIVNPGNPAKEGDMRLSPDEIIFWQHGFIKLNATIVLYLGVDARPDRWFNPDYTPAFQGNGTFPLAKFC